MKLEAVNIQNFRSIQEVTLEECGSFNVIVGKNNAGKSNILLAIDTIFKFLKQRKRNDFRSGTVIGIPIDFHRIDFHQNLVETPIEITLFFQLSPDERNNLIKEHVKDSVDLLEEPNKPAPQLSLALVVKAYATEFFPEESAPLFAYVETMVLCKSGYSTIQEDSIVCTIFNVNFIEQEIFIPEYVFNLIKQIGETNVLYLTERRKPIGKCEAAQLLDLKITRKSREKFRAIQEIIRDLLGVEIDPVRPNNTNSEEDPGAELDVDQFLVQINGAGIREALRLILDYELNQPNILLVEEPEIHLHPALETSMMRYLKSMGKNCQVFITTHSTNFLDTTEMKNVYLASREGSTNIQLINNVEEAEASIPRELGIRLSSLFMFDRLVFVEGPTDEYVIREWASICGVNLAQASVGIIPMGGVRSLPNFATEATINFLGKRRVSIFFMIDRDEREEAEINNFYERFGDRAKLIVLNKRELENYLLCPRAIVEFIKLKYGLKEGKGQKDIDLSEIEQAIDICADELKNVVLERRVTKIACEPIYPNREAVLNSDSGTILIDRLKEEYANKKKKLTELEESLETIIEKETKWIETNWATKKRDIVPGDMLLDNLCKKLFDGAQFNKKKDSLRLASLMTENEIDLEIKNILKSFAEFTSTI